MSDIDQHPDLEQLVRYAAGGLSESDQERVEIHIAGCPACTELGHRCFAAQTALDAWSVAAHADAQLKSTLALGLARAERETSNPSWRQRLERWQQKWAGAAEAVLRTGLEVSRVAAAGVDELTRAGGTWSFLPEPEPAGTWGDADDDDTQIVLATSTLRADEPRAMVEIRGASAEIIVRIDNLPAGGVRPMVVLIAMHPTGDVAARVAVVEDSASSGFATARFRDVPTGEYLIAFEPLADGRDQTT